MLKSTFSGYNAVADNTGLHSFISFTSCCLRNLRNPAEFSKKFNLQQLKQGRTIICVHKQLKSLRRHCTITGVGNVKQVSFKPGPEDCYGRCGSDRIWQTVPETSSGDRESSVTDGKESGVADNQ